MQLGGVCDLTYLSAVELGGLPVGVRQSKMEKIFDAWYNLWADLSTVFPPSPFRLFFFEYLIIVSHTAWLVSSQNHI